MALGTLTGHAIKMAGLPADHTYVTSSDGRVWPCWGRFTGGTAICVGAGNVDAAECLSQPNSKAGIEYGISGVCHQTANRILYPSGEQVSSATQSRLSYFAYGVYGRDMATGKLYSPPTNPWPELAACLNHSHP